MKNNLKAKWHFINRTNNFLFWTLYFDKGPYNFRKPSIYVSTFLLTFLQYLNNIFVRVRFCVIVSNDFFFLFSQASFVVNYLLQGQTFLSFVHHWNFVFHLDLPLKKLFFTYFWPPFANTISQCFAILNERFHLNDCFCFWKASSESFP